MPSDTQGPVGTDPRFPSWVNSFPFGLSMRISMSCASGALQLMVVCPWMAFAVTGIGFGFAVKDGPSEGQGALTDVRHWLPTNEFAPDVARFRMSTPLLVEGWSKSTCTAGFPVTRFARKRLPWTPGARKIPFVFPIIMFSSTTFPVSAALGRPMPKFAPWDVKPFPLSRFARSRLRLAPPVSHMPPQGLAPLPFRTETLFSIRLSDDPRLNRMPEAQLVDAVTPLTVTPVLPATWIPVFRNR